MKIRNFQDLGNYPIIFQIIAFYQTSHLVFGMRAMSFKYNIKFHYTTTTFNNEETIYKLDLI